MATGIIRWVNELTINVDRTCSETEPEAPTPVELQDAALEGDDQCDLVACEGVDCTGHQEVKPCQETEGDPVRDDHLEEDDSQKPQRESQPATRSLIIGDL